MSSDKSAQILSYQSSLPDASNAGGFSLPISARATDELKNWDEGSLKEDSVFAQKHLKKYWNATDYPHYADDSSIPWSAAFISYIMKPFGFPSHPAHSGYFEKVIQNPSLGFKTYALGSQYHPKVGDVLIDKNFHGDVVFLIEGDVAYTMGGNLSNSVKIGRQIPLSNGVMTDFSHYKLLIRNHRLWPSLAPKLFWTSLIGFYGFIGYRLFR